MDDVEILTLLFLIEEVTSSLCLLFSHLSYFSYYYIR